jgi:molecular chaperone GrpE (heat shock protein)
VIEQFADDEALLRARVDIYRTIVIEAVAHIEELAQSLTRLRDRYHRLQDEYRELRHRTMRRTEAPS